MAEVVIALAATNQEWAARLTEWITDHGGDARLRDSYLYSQDDALEESFDCLVGDAESTLLEPGLVAALHERGRLVVGVYDGGAPGVYRRLEQVGVDATVQRVDPPDEMLRAILRLAERQEFDALVGAIEPEDEPPEEAASHDRPPPPASCLTVVTGPTEGVGATEVAVEMAAALRLLDETVVLMDADLVRPCMAMRLRAPQTPNLNTAIDVVQRRGGTIAQALVLQPSGGFDLLVGLEHPKHWADLQPAEVADVVTRLRLIRRHIVVNVGSQLEELPGVGPGRHAIARRLIAAADRIVVTAEPSPIGVQSLCRWAVEVSELNDLGRVFVAFNRGGGREEADQVERETRRAFTPAGIYHVPEDPRVWRARWAGELVRPGPFTKAVSQLADDATPRLRTTRPRKRRRGR